jgi:cytochrome c
MRRLAIAGVLALVSILLVMVYMRTGGGGDARREDAAVAMVEKASAYLQTNGPVKAFAAFDDESNRDFHSGDIYVFVRTLDGNTLAHGALPVMIGQTDFNTVDADGKRYNKELVDLATTAGSGWVHYRWPNPLDKKVETKSTFVKRVGDYIVCAGYYDR